jgi:hypothetical protein
MRQRSVADENLCFFPFADFHAAAGMFDALLHAAEQDAEWNANGTGYADRKEFFGCLERSAMRQ